MAVVSNLLTKGRGWITGVNWYKYGAILAVLLATHSIAYVMGQTNERVEAAERVAEVAEARTETIIKEVEVRVPVIQEKDRQANELNKRVDSAGDNLDAAIQAHPNDPNCSLSPDELRYFRELSAATR